MTYTIKEFSQKLSLSPHTLRYYEKEGLLPSTKRLNNSHRVYDDSDIPWVTTICCLRSTGMSISDLKHYVELCKQGDSTVQERKQIILNQKQRLEEQLEQPVIVPDNPDMVGALGAALYGKNCAAARI